jgi:hypothetical protein
MPLILAAAIVDAINEAHQVLGPALHQTVLQTNSTPLVQRREWRCGCMVDFIDEDINATVALWNKRGNRRKIGLVKWTN